MRTNNYYLKRIANLTIPSETPSAEPIELTFSGTEVSQNPMATNVLQNVLIDWGDGNTETNTGNYHHIYTDGETIHTIKVYATKIDSRCFQGLSIRDVTIPNTVTSIGYSAFEGCSNLKEVTIGNGISILGDSVFKDCTSLQSINIPSTITQINNTCFSNVHCKIVELYWTDNIISYSDLHIESDNYRVPTNYIDEYEALNYPSNLLTERGENIEI